MIDDRIRIYVTVKPDLRLVDQLAQAYMKEYYHDPACIELTKTQGLTKELLTAYFHDAILIRLSFVDDAIHGTKNCRKYFGFYRSLMFPDGFSAATISRLGISDPSLDANYEICPVWPKDYRPDRSFFTDPRIVNLEKPILPQCLLDKQLILNISYKIGSLMNVMHAMDAQFSPIPTTKLGAIFAVMEQVNPSDVQVAPTSVKVAGFVKHTFDMNELKAAALMGFTLQDSALKVLYPQFELVNVFDLGSLMDLRAEQSSLNAKPERSRAESFPPQRKDE